MLLGSLTLFIGCNRKERGPAYGQQQEFRRQIADSIPVKQWGYAIADLRVSDDAQKVLVIFNLPGTNGVSELVLTNDGFRRYTGRIFDAEKRSAAELVRFGAELAQHSNFLARIRSGAPSNAPPSAPPYDQASSVKSLFAAGLAPVVVTLPDR